MFHAIYSTLRSSYLDVLSNYLDDGVSDDVAMPTVLTQLARLKGLCEERSQFTRDLVECVCVLVTRESEEGGDQLTDGPGGWALLNKLAKVHVYLEHTLK